MNYLNTGALLLAAYLAVFLAACRTPLSDFLGVQTDLLPALMVYCGLSSDWATLTIVALAGGLWFDALSSNPLGVTVIPLFLVAFIVQLNRGFILREQRYAQFVLGAIASAGAPAVTGVVLLGLGQNPLIGWGSFWQGFVMAVIGGSLTPVMFWAFERFTSVFNYQPMSETSFRPDREIKRGRV